jgi:hypothetical protein
VRKRIVRCHLLNKAGAKILVQIAPGEALWTFGGSFKLLSQNRVSLSSFWRAPGPVKSLGCKLGWFIQLRTGIGCLGVPLDCFQVLRPPARPSLQFYISSTRGTVALREGQPRNITCAFVIKPFLISVSVTVLLELILSIAALAHTSPES